MNPTRRLLFVVTGVLLVGLVTLWRKDLLTAWMMGAAFVLFVLCFDAIASLLQSSSLEATRRASDTLSLGAWHNVAVTI